VRTGQFGLSVIGGGLGRAIWFGQAVIGDRSKWTHAFLVLDEETVIEAMPRGARLAPLAPFVDKGERGQAVFSRLKLTDEQRATVVQVGREFAGTPYSFLDYLSIGLEHLRVRPTWVQRRVETSRRMICSQLVDRAYDIAGVHLFADGRRPGDVTPGDLTRCLDGNIPV
jgi:uncharacterized protein YycO